MTLTQEPFKMFKYRNHVITIKINDAAPVVSIISQESKLGTWPSQNLISQINETIYRLFIVVVVIGL